MPLHPQIKHFLDRIELLSKQISPDEMTIAHLRNYFTLTWSSEEVETVEDVQNLKIPGPESEIPIRIYKPEGEKPFPALVYYHGGGFVLGGLDSHDSICRSLANKASCIVISVDYRLAPENKFPAAVEDAFTALKWVTEHTKKLNIDPQKIAVGGDSAGGNLAAVMTIKAAEHGNLPIIYQLLIYPAVTMDTLFQYPSMIENASGYLLTRESILWFYSQYLSTLEDASNSFSSPLLHGALRNLPPATIITAQFDPLRDEGAAYAERLQSAGVSVNYRCYEGMIHQFMNLAHEVDTANEALEDIAYTLKAVFNS
ncbi:alpha/beta hydrolase [Paenibacillus sp. GSMTC-2017]|uniref:alpha/beta hydrolase n=1 Tax=Paenibacillus sp. GSMTC-2017 TaxID=2794350 RepID=UPI0018D953D2|nr:alpha/beta hydrolase [Paenibacillus sp. GSMTC-2017]MBH5316847.1 alpha/beta hydrolase [Paenibacillus sp. GSMTC-2017]